MSAMTAGSSARALTPEVRAPAPATSKTAPKTPAGRSTPLRLVPRALPGAARTPFVVVVVALLVAGLLGLLLLNTLVAQDSFALHDLAKQGRQLEQREQGLTKQVQALRAPDSLAARATALGMVPGGAPAFLRLTDGAVLGQPSPGVAPVMPAPVAATASGSTR